MWVHLNNLKNAPSNQQKIYCHYYYCFYLFEAGGNNCAIDQQRTNNFKEAMHQQST